MTAIPTQDQHDKLTTLVRRMCRVFGRTMFSATVSCDQATGKWLLTYSYVRNSRKATKVRDVKLAEARTFEAGLETATNRVDYWIFWHLASEFGGWRKEDGTAAFPSVHQQHKFEKALRENDVYAQGAVY